MKKLTTGITITALIAIVLISGCVQEQPPVIYDNETQEPETYGNVTLTVNDIGRDVEFNIQNNFNKNIYYKRYYTYQIFKYQNNGWKFLETILPCDVCGAPIPIVYELEPGESVKLSWNRVYYIGEGDEYAGILAHEGEYKVKFYWSFSFIGPGIYVEELDAISGSLGEPINSTEKEFELTTEWID
ncbi:MAG: hypothetical protein ACE5J4_02630 [Candidatus Aenigmatarchaeota archaeon]